MILKHLKTQTATLHQKTEEDNLAKYILDHSIDKETYKRLLQQNYLAYARIDALLASNASILTTELKPFADKA
ncbi:MAG: biliverdin-producing heme oxygenase, partial [Bacteroidota bacterium]|nr:biliverdin-producing heme oxygenase [Bacteroidota bacterium]